MEPISRIRGRLMPALSVALTLSACATSAQQPPVVSADAIMRVADMTAGEGDFGSAAGLYQKAHELNPTDPRPLIMLGQTLAKLGSPSGAAEAYRAALLLDGTNAEALRGLGTAMLNVGQPEAAISQYEKALDVGEDYRLYNGIAVSYDMLGDHASAQTYYRTALQLSPGNLELNNNLALSFALEGRYHEAIPLLQQVTADPMATPRYRQNLAFVYGLAGERDKARELASRDLDPATVERNMTYFEVLKGMGDDRTMASALGAHYADQMLANVPAGASPEADAAPVVAAPEAASITTAPVTQSELPASPALSSSVVTPAAFETDTTPAPIAGPVASSPHTETGESSAPLALIGDAELPVEGDSAQPEVVYAPKPRPVDNPIRSKSTARTNPEYR